jgi:hypothetical protein
MIQRKRARERISIPALNKFIYGAGLFEDKITQALINTPKFADDIPEQQEFNEFVSTNRVNRSIVYPLDHIGDRWGIFTKVPTAWSAINADGTVIGAGVESNVIIHSGLGLFRRAIIYSGNYVYEIVIKVDGTEIYRAYLPDILNYNLNDYNDGIVKLIHYNNTTNSYGFIIDKEFIFRNSFIIAIKNLLGSAMTFSKIRSIAQQHQINW